MGGRVRGTTSYIHMSKKKILQVNTNIYLKHSPVLDVWTVLHKFTTRCKYIETR